MPNKVIDELIDDDGDFGFDVARAQWAESYAKNGNKAQACRIAGVTENTGTKWKKDPKMKAAVARAKAMLANQSVDTDFLVGRINAIAKSCVSDYFDEYGDFIGFDKLTEIQKLCIKKFKKSRDKFGMPAYEVELYDVTQAADMLGRSTKLFDFIPEDEEIAQMSEEELEAEVRELDKKLK